MFDLRPYQQPIANIVFNYLQKNPGKHPLVGMPTGSGKTVVMADIIQQTIDKWPEINILVISHVKEILQQDYDSIKAHTGIDVGLHSAGLGKRECKQVTVAGIQSIYKQSERFKDYKFVIIDECHLIPPNNNSMYRTFFSGLPNTRYLGLTATPFRLGKGYIYGQEESLFDDMVYDLTSLRKFNKLIKDGYLCNLRTQATENEMDVNDISILNGDFDNKQLSSKFNTSNVTDAAIAEIVKRGASYKKWLIFAIDIKHAETIAEKLICLNIPTMVVHSRMEMDRDSVIQNYKRGRYRAIVNVNVLTTGFDDPEIDLIALLRPTQSPVIHVQTIGRGLRIAPSKDHCLILDFAGNTERLGPINDITVVPAGKRKKSGIEAEFSKVKECPKCHTIHHFMTRICDVCGHTFSRDLISKASRAEVIAQSDHQWHKIDDVQYYIHTKLNSPDMVKVAYRSVGRVFNEYICIDHQGNAGRIARHWASYRGVEAKSAHDLLKRSGELKKPNKIRVDTKGRYPMITDFEF